MQINDYMDSIPSQRREKFEALRQLVLSLYLEAMESMEYIMPTFTTEGACISLANQKQYTSLYTCHVEPLAIFKTKHPGIKTGKGCINFKDNDELPLHDLKQVIRNAMKTPPG